MAAFQYTKEIIATFVIIAISLNFLAVRQFHVYEKVNNSLHGHDGDIISSTLRNQWIAPSSSSSTGGAIVADGGNDDDDSTGASTTNSSSGLRNTGNGNNNKNKASASEPIITPSKSTSNVTTKKMEKKDKMAPKKNEEKKQTQTQEEEGHHTLGGLTCDKYGGPSDEIASEMVFWSDIPSDSDYKSPFFDPNKYVTFEPDHGGWNNIRMAMETVLVLAHAMGRTLVLPPEKGMYLLNKGSSKGHKDSFTFNDFFHLDSIAMEHEGFDIITMEEYLKRKQAAATDTSRAIPDNGRTNWDGKRVEPLFNYLREEGYHPQGWDPWKCIAAIPASSDQKDIDEMEQTMKDLYDLKYGPIPDNDVDYVDKPTDVDAPMHERMMEMLAGRKKLCMYDKEMQDADLIHFRISKEDRLLTHFYAFIFFQDWKHDLWSKRFVRDHIRYIDEMMCAAARVVNAVRERAKVTNKDNTKGEYNSFHVRRGDFQYKNTRLDAPDLYKISKPELEEGSTLFIATDERDKNFFQPFKDHYDVTFLDDYMHLLEGVNPNYYGMLDQLVASKGKIFFGTWFSTLSGYVNRMRGYYAAKHKLEGYELGTLPSFYFFPEFRFDQMRAYKPVKMPIYMREFPVSWRDIDKGID